MDLNHTIVPARDKVASARFFARIMGLRYDGPAGHFAPVAVNDALTMDFDNAEDFGSHHYAFKVSDAEFDGIFARIKKAGVVYGSGPFSATDGGLNIRLGGRGFYWPDHAPHLLELLTRAA